MKTYDAQTYWESRLGQDFSLGGVGQIQYGVLYNEWLYRIRKNVFLSCMRRAHLDFKSVGVLDVGCGTGFYVERWQELGVRSLTGLDITEASVAGLREKYPQHAFYRASIDEAPGEILSNQFDAVSCMDVLFHIVDDQKHLSAFRNIHRMLRPGGLFVFTDALPHVQIQSSPHVVFRSQEQVLGVCELAGFQIIRVLPVFHLMVESVGPPHWLLSRFWQTARRLISRAPSAGFYLGAILYPLELALLSGLRIGGESKIVVCQKINGSGGSQNDAQ